MWSRGSARHRCVGPTLCQTGTASQAERLGGGYAAKSHRRLVWWQTLFLAACSLAAFAFAITWIQVRPYPFWDDEGFMLFTLRQWLSGTSLYDTGYTEYGFFYYLAYSAWFRVSGMTPDHDALRGSTVVLWVVASLGCASCVWAVRRSVVWTAVERDGRISWRTTATPDDAACQAASLPARPPPMMWTFTVDLARG